MRVTTEMVQAYKQAEDDILWHWSHISEIIILATPVDPNNFDPSTYATMLTNIMKYYKSISKLRDTPI